MASAHEWRAVLEPVVDRYRSSDVIHPCFRNGIAGRSYSHWIRNTAHGHMLDSSLVAGRSPSGSKTSQSGPLSPMPSARPSVLVAAPRPPPPKSGYCNRRLIDRNRIAGLCAVSIHDEVRLASAHWTIF